jgi:hypothetical protein
MKRMIYFLVTIIVVFAATQIWAKVQSAKIEMHPYEVLSTFNGFEIRKYAPATFSYVNLDVKTYSEGSSQGFRKLAGYIFGGNDKQERIAMTSPVEMEMDSQMVVKFLVPAAYRIEDLPVPNNKEVKFVNEPERIVAAIRFSGFANNFSFLGYNSPFDLINRRNEMIVGVEFE